VQSGLAIKVLSLEAQVLVFEEVGIAGFLGGAAPDLVAELPDEWAINHQEK